MSGAMVEDYETGGRSSSTDEMLSEQRCQSGDSLAEWRSCEQVENGTPSTSPPFWDTDDEDDCGPKPSDLYGRFTWKIEEFSKINKRELRSNAFEVGGYKWYILIYPQGCDVCNHLSLFLCVANHDKLLPGWSHFAQFTIAVVNKDPKKSKYSDTLHRFWKKEHDWGWKKFMELSKVYDGFIVADTLVIKAQVQVIREKAHRPFRCLDRQYRRELVRVYLSNVEQICRRFVEERRGKLSKLMEDKVRWSSFCAFWFGIDPSARRRMSRDKTDAVLKIVVKHFFIEKEVTSTLVMDSLYSGLKALECQSKNKKGRAKLIDMEELPVSMVLIDKDMFVLADDVLLLLERAVSEPLPNQPLPPKDDKCAQNRTKDGNSGEEFNKDSIERDERRLTELGRRTLEIFVLAHIFSRIEVAYQEAVALKRQEELIREEEAAGQAENELRAKRSAAEKEKRAKKKQGKQKRNNRKGKDRGRDEKSDAIVQEKLQQQNPCDEKGLDDFTPKKMESVIEKIDTLEDASDGSNGEEVAEILQPDLDDRDNGTINWDTDATEIQPPTEASSSEVQNGQMDKRNPSVMDDSSSTCSTDSVPSIVMNGPYKANTLPTKGQASPSRAKNQRGKEIHERTGFTHGGNNPPSDTAVDADRSCDVPSSRSSQPESETVVHSSKNQVHRFEQHFVEKEEEVVSLQKKLNVKDQVDVERPSKTRIAESSSSSSSPGKKPPYVLHQPKQSSETTAMTSATTASTMVTAEPVSSKEAPSSSTPQNDKQVPPASRSPQISSTSRSEASRHTIRSKCTSSTNQVTAMSRPSSAPLIPAPRPTAPVPSTVQTAPLLSRSVSAAGRLGTDPSPSAPSYIPQSYRNAIMGKTTMGASPAGFAHRSTSSGQGVGYSQPHSAVVSSSSVLPPQNFGRKDQTSVRPGFTFGSVKPEALHGQPPWKDDCSHQEASSSNARSNSNLASDVERLDIGEMRAKHFSAEIPSRATSYHALAMVADEFPHLDIINDLLDEEQSNGKATKGLQHHHHSFSRQYSFPGNASATDIGSLNGSSRFDQDEQYYDEGFRRVYGSSNSSLHGLREGHVSQVDISAYANGHVDGVMQNQWPYSRTDLSMLNLGTGDANGYSYQLPEYSNLVSGVNGYNMYRPANGP
ncbi:TNF receptor-associated factor homolog 1a isoform X2 [Elaeis guineensis]|uniref:TNF receptor-associated factor homolog 1a isoform X2 n=1 Tax=Elaeis guineensis var. tenera TaxID=51953 RepID=A0A6I9RUH4_ELAGV|nr:TNF receptor-associated factor homolog 1a isoform X2 [Elaeis guineensis]